LSHVAAVIAQHLSPVWALRPFVDLDPDVGIARLAYRWHALLFPVHGEDPLVGPKWVRTQADINRDPFVRISAIAGLLSLCDRRVQPVLDSAWLLFDAAAAAELVRISAVMVSQLAVEFFLGWAEQHDLDFGCWALCRLATASPEEPVWDIERAFPVNAPGASSEPRVLSRATFAEYWPVIEPRIRRLVGKSHAYEQIRSAWQG
jgi:hypothetical protein